MREVLMSFIINREVFLLNHMLQITNSVGELMEDQM